MAENKIVSQEVLNLLIDKIQEVINNYCWDLEYFTEEECNSFFDGTQEEVDYYQSLIKDDVVSKNFLHSSKQISEDIANAIIEANGYADSLIRNISTIKLEYVTVLPTTDISENTIYILKNTDSTLKDTLNLYNTTNGWTEIGSFDISMSDYIDKTTYDSDMSLKANLSEVVNNDKIVQSLDSTTNSANTILSTNGLEIELNKKIDKTNIVTEISTTNPNDEKVTSESSIVKCMKGVSKEKTISWAEYQALSEEEKNNGTTYYIPDMPQNGVIPDVPLTDVTFTDTTHFTNDLDSSRFGYRIINEICFVTLLIRCVTPVDSCTVVKLPKPIKQELNSFVCWNPTNSELSMIRVYVLTNGNVVLGGGKEQEVYIANFSYPVVES